MKKILCLFFTIFCVFRLQAQHKVTFIVKESTSIVHDSIYVTGSFSNWDSTANPAYLMNADGDRQKSITLTLQPGIHRYKFHRGSWFTVEKLFSGMEVPDRAITIRHDTVLHDNITAWRDQLFIDKWQALSQPLPDTSRLRTLASLANVYAFIFDYYNTDSAFYYAQQALQVVHNMQASNMYKQWFEDGNIAELIMLQETVAVLLHSLGNYPRALEIRLDNLKLAEKDKDTYSLVWAFGNITSDYLSMKDYPRMLDYALQQDSVLAIADTKDYRYQQARIWTKNNVAIALYNLKDLSGALAYSKEALKAGSLAFEYDYVFSSLLLADIYAAMNKSDSALTTYKYVIASTPSWARHIAARAQSGMARVYQKNGRIDSALFFGKRALDYFQNNSLDVQAWGETSLYYVAEVCPLLAELYKANNQLDSAYKYLQLSITVKDSLYNEDKVRQFQTLGFNEANRRLQLEQQSREEKQRYDTRVKMYGLISIITGFVILAFILYRNNRQKQKANTVLQSQKQEIEKTLGELKTTQKQLIQSEKMASLGELTAGIAHEIQNPLNFVNNFTEVNGELLLEMNDELTRGNMAAAKLIANDAIENQQKILHHGKRADAIVKGMLQHSRSSSSAKELTDINALADEYLRLAYHGLRAKEKSFTASTKTEFDERVDSINIIPQDIGRVILNIITNAFYAVREKNELLQAQGDNAYEPTVSVSTKKTGDNVVITVKDNGNGIPQNVLDKIFQPFFTTKPAGQGTGLGLSLSYDIVKAHGGELKVETKEGVGTAFSIILPLR